MVKNKKVLDDIVGKEILVDKEDFYVKLFDYDADGTLSNYFSTTIRFYETKNLKVDCFYKYKTTAELIFYIRPRRKEKIGFKYGVNKYE